jgi:hypothetical protein
MIGKGGTSSRRTHAAASALLALLVHVLIASVFYVLPARTPAQDARHAVATRSHDTPAEAPIDLTLESLPPASAPEPVHDAPPSLAPSRARESEGAAASVARPTAGAVAERPRTEGAEAAEGPAGSSAAPLTFTQPGAPDIGIGGKNRFLPTSEAAVEAAESSRAVGNALRDPARQREQELGLGPEGPVLTALADGTARSLAPVTGKAVFVATSNAEGIVVSLEVADAEGGRPGWADAGRLALGNLGGVKLRVAPGSTRTVMRIEVASAWKLPSGRDPGVDVTLFHVPIHRGAQGPTSSKISILDPIPKLKVHYLELGGPQGVKIPIVSVEVDLLNVPVDPVDIGANARRVIHTHLLDSKAM